MKSPTAINNSFQILEDLKAKCHHLYFTPKVKHKKPKHEKPGPVKVYTEEEIHLYKLSKYSRSFHN